jgi:hypothetical protein
VTLFLLMLHVVAGFLAGAGVALWWVSGGPDHRDVDELARRDRIR